MRNQRALRAAAALAEAVTVADAIDAIFEHVVRAFGGVSVGVWLVDDDNEAIRLAGGAGLAYGSVAEVEMDSALPVAVAARTGEPQIYRSPAERASKWPDIATPGAHQAGAIVPLQARGRRLGCLTIGFAQAPTASVFSSLAAVANQCALALDRALLYEAEREANDTLEFLAAGTALMISALEPEEVVRRLVDLAVPRLVDSCGVFLAEGRALTRAAVAVRGFGELTGRIGTSSQIPLDANVAVAAAYRTGRPHPFDDPVAEALAAGLPAAAVDVLREAGVTRGVAIPLAAGGETVGVMVVAYHPGRRPTRHDDFALNGVAGRAAIALANARRFRRQSEVAEMLAAAVLPAELPVPPSIQLAARYIPAAGTVAGDWFDAFTRKDGTVIFGVGDAAGHGLPAVAAMAELRHAARALCAAGMAPSEVLGHLSGLLEMTARDDRLATALYCAIDPLTGHGRWANAGHIPPLVVSPDGQSQYLSSGGLPLGAVSPASYTDAALSVPAGGLLMAITDGVIERRHGDIEVGLDRLRTMAAQLVGQPAQALADAVASEFCVAPSDDCCVMVLRRIAGPH